VPSGDDEEPVLNVESFERRRERVTALKSSNRQGIASRT
jgi:hypothetical protein